MTVNRQRPWNLTVDRQGPQELTVYFQNRKIRTVNRHSYPHPPFPSSSSNSVNSVQLNNDPQSQWHLFFWQTVSIKFYSKQHGMMFLEKKYFNIFSLYSQFCEDGYNLFPFCIFVSRFHLLFPMQNASILFLVTFPEILFFPPHWYEIGSWMSCAKALNASGVICIVATRKSKIDVWRSNSSSLTYVTFMSSCYISHCLVYIIFKAGKVDLSNLIIWSAS